MGKFVIACPSCGRYTEASTGFFAKKQIPCSCGYTIQVKTDRMTTRECPHCGNMVAYDQAKGNDAVCPVCQNQIMTEQIRSKMVEFVCPSCSCHLSAAKDAASYTCPLWSRFLGLIEKGEKKTLIPCYKGIDVYDMPREFARLQAQDMGKIGAMQDLLRGVGKIIGVKTSVNVDNAHMEEVEREPSALAQRGNMALEDGDFSGADEYFERALDANPADAYAYLGKFLVRYQFSSLDDFENKVCRLEESKEFKRAEQFADIVLAKKLKSFRELNEIKIERMHLIDVLKKISQKKIEEEPLRLMREAEKLRQQEMIQRATYDEACARVKSRISYEDAPYIARLEEEFDAKIKDVQRKIEEEISINKGARDSFDDEISNLYNQKASLGLFKGKEKKAIQIKIDEIQNKMNQIESEPQVQNKYQNQLNQINREKRAEVNKITADIGSKYTMPKFEDFADCTRN